MLNLTQDPFSGIPASVQPFMVPGILLVILALGWDTWKKSRAVYAETFGDPNKKADDGAVGRLHRIEAKVEAVEDSVHRLEVAVGSTKSGNGLTARVVALEEYRRRVR